MESEKEQDLISFDFEEDNDVVEEIDVKAEVDVDTKSTETRKKATEDLNEASKSVEKRDTSGTKPKKEKAKKTVLLAPSFFAPKK